MFKQIADSFGFETLPDKYLVLDCETSGVDCNRDSIIQVGFCAVDGRKSQMMGAVNIKRPDGVVRDWPTITRITGITQAMLDVARPPEEVLPKFADMVQSWLDEGHLIVGHNFLRFDLPFFNRSFAEVKDRRRIPKDRCLDTGMMVKASRINMSMLPNETFDAFALRVDSIRRKGLYWSLDRYCIDAYGLEKRGVDRSLAHNAGYDCFMTHMLLEVMREQFEGKPQ